MAEGLDALRSYGNSDSNATASEDDGGSGVYPSHGELDMHKKDAFEDSVDDASDSSRSSINARMAERHARIRKHKLKRRGLLDSEEEESEEIFGRNAYRQLAMPQKFTPPRKKSKIVVADSDDSLRSVSANENSEEDESGDDDDVALFTPKRIYQTDWKVVEKWSTSISLPEIDRQIDAILARCLRSAGYVAEHVAKTKATDRSYWKETHVSSLFNVAQPHC
jgi:hypothetical protein